MRPQDVVIGLERNVSDRARLEEQEHQFELEKPEAYDEAVAESRHELRAHHDAIMAAVLAIIEKRDIVLDKLDISEQEQSALEALRTAFSGKDRRHAKFVFAEQRRELLEQALAALQPALALDISHTSELKLSYDRIVEEVTELRERLEGLEDAQDDERMHELQVSKEEPKDEDDSTDTAEDSEAAPKPSTVWQPGEADAGPAVSAAPKPSTVWQPGEADPGPTAGAAPKPSTVWQPGEDATPAASERSQGGMLSRISRALGLGGKNEGG